METLSWLTKDYLEEVIQKNCNDPEIAVENFDVRSATTKGDNYGSVIHRVAVSYRDLKGNYVKNFIVKSPKANEMVQSNFDDMLSFKKEIAAYSKLIPAMRNLSELPLEFPRYYATDRADIVIMEDLSARGFQMADRKNRLDLSHCFLVLKALARFHGLSFAVVQRDPSILDHFPETITSDRMKKIDKSVPKLYKDIADLIQMWPGYEAFPEKIIKRSAEIHKQTKESLVPKEGAFNVLNHGDLWINNMLFRYDEETKKVEDVCLIDLQVIRYTSPAVDIQLFMTSSLADGIRNEHEDRLLEAYHQELAKTLKSVGIDSSSYSLEDLKKDYIKTAPYGFQAGMLIFGLTAFDPNETIEFEDTGDGSASMVDKKFRGKGYRLLMQQHLVYNEKKGVL